MNNAFCMLGSAIAEILLWFTPMPTLALSKYTSAIAEILLWFTPVVLKDGTMMTSAIAEILLWFTPPRYTEHDDQDLQ